jgi:hypothetical protein
VKNQPKKRAAANWPPIQISGGRFMNCQGCNNPQAEGATVCQNCGMLLGVVTPGGQPAPGGYPPPGGYPAMPGAAPPEEPKRKRRAVFSAIGTVLIVGIGLFLFLWGGRVNYISLVQDFAPWDEFRTTYNELFNRFVTNPDWSESRQDGHRYVHIRGNLNGTGEQFATTWRTTASQTQRNLTYIHLASIQIGNEVFDGFVERQDISWLMFLAFNEGFQQFRLDDWLYAVDDLIDPALFGLWFIVDETAAGWFIGGETLEFFSNGFGVERLSFSAWEFEWFADGFHLHKDYGDFYFDYTYMILGGELRLTDDIGNTIIFTAEQGSQAAAPPQEAAWRDMGMISFPQTWDYAVDDFFGDVDFWGPGVGGTLYMAAWAIMVGDPYMIVDEALDILDFLFDDGHMGYILEFPESVTWIRMDSDYALSHYFGDDWDLFLDNMDLLFDIARTLR